MLVNHNKLVLSREDVKNLEYPNLKDIQFLEATESPSQSYYPSIIAIIERLFYS